MPIVKSKVKAKVKTKVNPSVKRVMNFWTEEEDCHVVEMFNDLILNQSCTLTEAKHKVAEKTNRTFDAVNYRYHKKFSTAIDQKALLKIKENLLTNINRNINNTLVSESSLNQDIRNEDSLLAENVDFSLLPTYLNEYNELQEQIAVLVGRSNRLLQEIKKYEEFLASLGSKEQERRDSRG